MACQPHRGSTVHAREPLEAQVRRFPRCYRRRLRKLVRGSSRLGELLHSFPGLAFVLVAGGRSHVARGEAVKLVKDGRPLPEAAAALGLPLWMKRLPPEAFTGVFGDVPGDEGFSRRIVNEVPAEPDKAAMWLRWVLAGVEACDESFALWLAKRKIYRAEDAGKLPLLPLAAYAWFSRQEHVPARGLIARPWHGNIGFGAAVDEMRSWLERVVLHYCRDGARKNGGWFKRRKACGYRFTPLLTPAELEEEGQKMDNCVATYAPKVASGACLIYSIRRGSQRAATMEIVRGQGKPVIAQLLAAGNAKAGEDVWRAANNWLSRLGDYPIATRDAMAQVPIIPGRWQAIWQPYWEDKPQFKACLAEPSMRTLVDLRQDMNALARLAKR